MFYIQLVLIIKNCFIHCIFFIPMQTIKCGKEFLESTIFDNFQLTIDMNLTTLIKIFGKFKDKII